MSVIGHAQQTHKIVWNTVQVKIFSDFIIIIHTLLHIQMLVFVNLAIGMFIFFPILRIFEYEM